MTTMEWVQTKKRLSDQENEISQRLSGIKKGPRFIASDEDADRKVPTLRWILCEQLEEIQRTRKRIKPIGRIFRQRRK
jgi:hypothetical protein